MIYYNKRQYYNYKLEKGGIMELTIDSIFTKLEAVNYDYIFTNNFFEIKEEEITYGSKIKHNQGNIPIKLNLLNKYENVREIFDNESNKIKRSINLKNDIVELKNIDIKKLDSKKVKDFIKKEFRKSSNDSIIINNASKIIITNGGIEESVNKIFNSRTQRNLLKEHLYIFLNLNKILSGSKLINQTKENKGRVDINYWNYYFNKVNIDGQEYNIAIDVRAMKDGTNQYRVQRIEKNKN